MTASRWFLASVAILAVALVLPSVRAGMRYDDYVVLAILSGSDRLSSAYPSRLDIFNFFNGSAERRRQLVDRGLLPWWTSSEVRVAFWRPVSALTHWLDHRLWRTVPELMHAQNLLWFGVLVVTTGALYRNLIGPGSAAGLAALFYALDSVHADAVVTISSRNAILGAVFGALAVLFQDRWRRAAWRPGAVFAPACLGLALLSVESAIATVAYLIAHTLCLDVGGWRRRVFALVPHGLVVVAWQLSYTAMDYGVFKAAPGYINPVREPLQFAHAVVKNGPILLLAEWTGPSSDTFPVMWTVAAAGRWIATVLAAGMIGAIMMPLLRRDRIARFWGMGQLLAVVPICAAIPVDRYLFFVGMGASGLFARFTCDLVDRASWRPGSRLWRVGAAVVSGVFVVVHLLVAPIQLVQAAVRPASEWLERASASLPDDAAVRRQTVVIVNAPNAQTIAYAFFVRTYKGQPIPKHIRLLSSGDGPVSVSRADAHTVRVRWDGRLEQMLFRSPESPIAVHERIRLDGTNIEVVAVSKDGMPAEAMFRFDGILEGPTLRWLRWDSGRFVDFRPPAAGETIVVR